MAEEKTPFMSSLIAGGQEQLGRDFNSSLMMSGSDAEILVTGCGIAQQGCSSPNC